MEGHGSKCYTVSMNQVQATIADQEFLLADDEVERSLLGVMPEPIGEHYVVIGGRRFPPKQVLGVVTGLDRADFNTHQARRVLARLGFTVGRRSKEVIVAVPEGVGPHQGREAELLRAYRGRWVAQRGLEVLVAADTPQAVLAWLERHNQQADVMFRVPADEAEAGGSAPA